MTLETPKKEFTFEIPGEPIPKKRPRFCSTGMRVRTYDIQKDQTQNIRKHIMLQMGKERIISRLQGPIMVFMYFFLPIPSSWSLKRSNEVEGTPHRGKPDLDNLIKMYSDAMNGLIYADDSQIAIITSTKIYSKIPKTIIHISALQENNLMLKVNHGHEQSV